MAGPLFAGIRTLSVILAIIMSAVARAEEQPSPSDLLQGYDNELRDWDAKIAGESDLSKAFYLQGSKSECAWRAAKVAVRAGRLAESLPYLAIMLQPSSIGTQRGAERTKDVEELLKSPNSVLARIKFADSFWSNSYSTEDERVEGQKLLIGATQLDAKPDEKRILYWRILYHSIGLKDVAVAREYADRIRTEFPDRVDDCDRALFELSRCYWALGDKRSAHQALEQILAEHPHGKTSGLAHIGLSEYFESEGDQAQFLRHLEMASEAPAEEISRHVMEASDSRQMAVTRLAKHYESVGDYTRALNYYLVWQPTSWCGTCAQQMISNREAIIAECMARLGDNETTLRGATLPRLTEDYANRDPALLAVAVYEERNRLEALVELLRPITKKNRLAKRTLELARIRLELDDRKIQRLVARLRPSGNYVVDFRDPPDNWEALAAAQALSELNGAEFPALAQQYRELSRELRRGSFGGNYDERTCGARRWVLFAIGLSTTAEARTFLENEAIIILECDKDDLQYVRSLRSRVKKANWKCIVPCFEE